MGHLSVNDLQTRHLLVMSLNRASGSSDADTINNSGVLVRHVKRLLTVDEVAVESLLQW